MRDRYKFVEKDGVYFITSTIVEWIPAFISGTYFEIVIDSLKYCMINMSLNLYAYVILDNHFHLVAFAPDFSKTIASLRKFTARKIIDRLQMDNKEWLLNQLMFYKKKYKIESDFQVWQEGVHPELIQNHGMFLQKIEYIHNNPVKRGLVDAPEHWRYSSARNYQFQDDSIIAVDCSLLL
jgi:putative transposase